MKAKEHNRELEKFIKLVNRYLENLDEEMEHGCYGTPEDVPYQFQDERDYYGKHEKITDKVAKCRFKIRDFISNYQEKFK